MQNTVIQGDNLLWLPSIPDKSIDMCYIDPPFYSNRNHVTYEGKLAFSDVFNDVFECIEWMRPRIELIHRKLKDTGSIFLHCDWHASHRLRCLLDDVFGEKNIVNEIYWKRSCSHNHAKKKFPDIVDTILFFKRENFRFTPVYGEHNSDYIKKFYRHDDGDGRGVYHRDNMAHPVDPYQNGKYKWKGFDHPLKGWRYKKSTMERLDKEGRIYYPTNQDGTLDTSKRLQLKRYLSELKGKLQANLWDDIPNIRHSSKEKIGYPTQKPEALLKRVIECSTQEGDVVLDCFAGSFTTAKVAADLNRKFISGDLSPISVQMGIDRLKSNGIEFNLVDRDNYGLAEGKNTNP